MLMTSSRFLFKKYDRFARLMALYNENYHKLHALFSPDQLAPGLYVSDVGNGLPLHLEVFEQHRYTTELKLTYTVIDPVTGQPDPSAFIRMYRDAIQAEATHCYVGKRWQDVMDMHRPAAEIVGYRLRMNIFLSKWLDHLEQEGHSQHTLHFAGSVSSDKKACEIQRESV